MSEVDKYIESLKGIDANVLVKVLNLRNFIKEQMPNATEVMSYGIPTYKLKKNIIHFAVNKGNIGIYPGSKAIEEFKTELTNFKTSKGTIQVPLDEDLPFELIQRFIEFNIKLYN